MPEHKSNTLGLYMKNNQLFEAFVWLSTSISCPVDELLVNEKSLDNKQLNNGILIESGDDEHIDFVLSALSRIYRVLSTLEKKEADVQIKNNIERYSRAPIASYIPDVVIQFIQSIMQLRGVNSILQILLISFFL